MDQTMSLIDATDSREMRAIEGALRGEGKRFGIVAARFNGTLVDGLLGGAVDCLLRHGTAAEAI